MGSWDPRASGGWEHTGTTRDFLRATGALATLPAVFDITLQAVTPDDELAFVIWSSVYGDTCLLLGFDDTDVYIAKRVLGVDTSIEDAPHGLAAGESFSLRVRYDGENITATILRSSGAEVEVELDDAAIAGDDDIVAMRYQAAWGVVSEVDGAVIAWLQLAAITRRFETVTEVLWWLIRGDLYACYDQVTATLIATRLMPETGLISYDEVEPGTVIFLGGGRLVKFTVAAREAEPFLASAGSFPGQTDDGTTTCTGVGHGFGSMLLFGDPAEPNKITYSALTEIANFDQAALEVGHAGFRTFRDPVVAVHEGPESSTFVAGTNSSAFWLGSPHEGNDIILYRDFSVGAAGPRSVTLTPGPNRTGAVTMLAPEGLMLCPVGADPLPFSQGVLSAYLTFPREDRGDFNCFMLRDPARGFLYVFVDDGTADAVAIFYAEFVGGYGLKPGGFYPQTFPVRLTCGCVWLGQPILGTEDGTLVVFDDTGTEELEGPRSSEFTFALIRDPVIGRDIELRNIQILVGAASSPVNVTVYKGVTPEEALTPASRRQAGAFTVRPYDVSKDRLYSGPALAVRMSHSGVGAGIIFEQMQGDLTPGEYSRQRPWTTAAAPGAPCTPPVAVEVPPPPPPPPDGGGPGTRPTGVEPPPPPPPPPGPPPPPDPESVAMPIGVNEF